MKIIFLIGMLAIGGIYLANRDSAPLQRTQTEADHLAPNEPSFEQLDAALETARKEEAQARTKALERLAAKSSEYSAHKQHVTSLHEKLDEARRTSDTAAKLAASKEFNEAWKQLKDQEASALAHDPAVAKALSARLKCQKDYIEAQQRNADNKQREQKAAAAADQLQEQLRQPIELVVGGKGTLPPFTITQIIDGHKMLIRLDDGTRLMLEGVPTFGYADDERKFLSNPVKIVGTQSYTTVLGATSTVLLANPI